MTHSYSLLLLCLLVAPDAGAAAAVRAAPGWQPPALAAARQAAAQGPLGARLERATHRLTQAPYNLQFILADVSFAQQRIFTEYSGDVSGRMVSVVASEIAAGRKPSWPLQDLLEGLQRYQQPDGHFGKPQDLQQSITGERDMPILWGNGRLLAGLTEAYDATGSAEALAMARRLGDYYVNTDAILDRPELVQKFGNYASGFATCYFSSIEGLVSLSRATKDQRYLQQAARMADLMAKTSPLGEMHSHGRLCASRGLLGLYQATHDQGYLDRVVQEHDAIRQRYLWPTGGLSEMMVRSFGRDEGCSEADWLDLNLRLWRLTGRDSYLDLAEVTLANELALNQFPNGGFGHHVAAHANGLMDGYYSLQHQGVQEAYWCCAEHCPHALLAVPAYVAAVRGQDLYLNLYQPAQVQLPVGRAMVGISVQPLEHGQRVQLRLAPDRPMRFALHLRIPSWAGTFSVQGAAGQRDGSGRFVVDRRWTGPSTIDITMPYQLTYHSDNDLLAGHSTQAMKAPVPGALLFLGPYLLGYNAPDTEAARPGTLAAGRAQVDAAALTATLPRSDGTATVTFHPVEEFATDGSGFRLRADLNP